MHRARRVEGGPPSSLGGPQDPADSTAPNVSRLILLVVIKSDWREDSGVAHRDVAYQYHILLPTMYQSPVQSSFTTGTDASELQQLPGANTMT